MRKLTWYKVSCTIRTSEGETLTHHSMQCAGDVLRLAAESNVEAMNVEPTYFRFGSWR